MYKRIISGAVYLQQPNAWDEAHMSCCSYILTRMAVSKFNIFRIGNKVWTKTCTNKNMRMPGTFPRDASCCRHGSSSNSKRKLLASFNNASTFSFRKHQNHPLALLNFLQLWPELTNYQTIKSRWSFDLCLTSLFVNTYLFSLQQFLPFCFGHTEKQYLSWELRNVHSHN